MRIILVWEGLCVRILIASTIVPFIEGGGTFIVDWLDRTLQAYGYQTEVLKIPFLPHYPRMPEQMLALRLFDLGDKADRLIALRTPSYLLQHPDKVVWFMHHHRTVYDLWNTTYRDIPETPEGLRIRDTIVQADNVSLREARKLFAISRTVSERLKEYNRLDSEVLYPPLLLADRYRCEDYGDFLFYPSRITPHKRQHLAVEAMKHTKSDVKLVIAGSPEHPPYWQQILSFVEQHRLHDKVKLIDHWISDEEKIAWMSRCLACVYIPFQEDYGYPSLEAYRSHKPVVTCDDSGSTHEFVEDGVTGRMAAPDPAAIANVFDELYMHMQQAQTMGRAGYEKLASMHISWDRVIERLTT